MTQSSGHGLTIGATAKKDGVFFRVWAPDREKVSVVISDKAFPMQEEEDGYFSTLASEAKMGDLYRFKLDDEDDLFSDPASRFQPDGPHGPSQVVDPSAFQWSDDNFKGTAAKDHVLYEMHIGTFTKEGTWNAAARHLTDLKETGITTLEIMPVADFAGNFGWGYDCVNLFAPSRLYGSPDDFRLFVDQAHDLGLSVILDVVYNHVGPEGIKLEAFAKDYFHAEKMTDWGPAINFDGNNARAVRDYFIGNALYWLEEFHLDGLRLDATQNIYDESEKHVLAEMAEMISERIPSRPVLLVAENESQDTTLLRPLGEGGYGLTTAWNDDFHHSATVVLTGKREAYYTDYLGKAQEFISALKYGYLFQGQFYDWQDKRRGRSTLGLPQHSFVNFIENHDQIANSGSGKRMHQISQPGSYRAMTALMLLGPQIPLLFQGQEFGSSRPFYYFADFQGKLGKMVNDGRIESLSQFPSLATEDMKSRLAEACSERTFQDAKLDQSERDRNIEFVSLHKDLLTLRRDDSVIGKRPVRIDGAVLSDNAFLIRYFADDGMDRLMIVNFGANLYLNPSPEPLLAPPLKTEWGVLWSSEDTIYGGYGTPDPDTDENWRIPGYAALVLKPKALS